MKKVFLSLVAVMSTLVASAQYYVGGQAGFWRDYDGNQTTLTIAPEIGYNLSDKWAIGTSIGYIYQYDNGSKLNGFVVSPYARYTFADFGAVKLIVDGGFGFTTYKQKVGGVSGDAQNAWEVGLKPGVSVNLTEKLTFISHVGFLGWRDSDSNLGSFGQDGLGFSLSGADLSFGLLYNF